MMKSIQIEALLLSKSVRLIINDDVNGHALCHYAMHEHISIHGDRYYKKSKVISAINITQANKIGMHRKIKATVKDGDKIWLLTDVEWDRFRKYLEALANSRHGKLVSSAHPSLLSRDEVITLIRCHHEAKLGNGFQWVPDSIPSKQSLTQQSHLPDVHSPVRMSPMLNASVPKTPSQLNISTQKSLLSIGEFRARNLNPFHSPIAKKSVVEISTYVRDRKASEARLRQLLSTPVSRNQSSSNEGKSNSEFPMQREMHVDSANLETPLDVNLSEPTILASNPRVDVMFCSLCSCQLQLHHWTTLAAGRKVCFECARNELKDRLPSEDTVHRPYFHNVPPMLRTMFTPTCLQPDERIEVPLHESKERDKEYSEEKAVSSHSGKKESLTHSKRKRREFIRLVRDHYLNRGIEKHDSDNSDTVDTQSLSSIDPLFSDLVDNAHNRSLDEGYDENSSGSPSMSSNSLSYSVRNSPLSNILSGDKEEQVSYSPIGESKETENCDVRREIGEQDDESTIVNIPVSRDQIESPAAMKAEVDGILRAWQDLTESSPRLMRKSNVLVPSTAISRFMPLSILCEWFQAPDCCPVPIAIDISRFMHCRTGFFPDNSSSTIEAKVLPWIEILPEEYPASNRVAESPLVMVDKARRIGSKSIIRDVIRFVPRHPKPEVKSIIFPRIGYCSTAAGINVAPGLIPFEVQNLNSWLPEYFSLTLTTSIDHPSSAFLRRNSSNNPYPIFTIVSAWEWFKPDFPYIPPDIDWSDIRHDMFQTNCKIITKVRSKNIERGDNKGRASRMDRSTPDCIDPEIVDKFSLSLDVSGQAPTRCQSFRMSSTSAFQLSPALKRSNSARFQPGHSSPLPPQVSSKVFSARSRFRQSVTLDLQGSGVNVDDAVPYCIDVMLPAETIAQLEPPAHSAINAFSTIMNPSKWIHCLTRYSFAVPQLFPAAAPDTIIRAPIISSSKIAPSKRHKSKQLFVCAEVIRVCVTSKDYEVFPNALKVYSSPRLIEPPAIGNGFAEVSHEIVFPIRYARTLGVDSANVVDSFTDNPPVSLNSIKHEGEPKSPAGDIVEPNSKFDVEARLIPTNSNEYLNSIGYLESLRDGSKLPTLDSKSLLDASVPSRIRSSSMETVQSRLQLLETKSILEMLSNQTIDVNSLKKPEEIDTLAASLDGIRAKFYPTSSSIRSDGVEVETTTDLLVPNVQAINVPDSTVKDQRFVANLMPLKYLPSRTMQSSSKSSSNNSLRPKTLQKRLKLPIIIDPPSAQGGYNSLCPVDLDLGRSMLRSESKDDRENESSRPPPPPPPAYPLPALEIPTLSSNDEALNAPIGLIYPITANEASLLDSPAKKFSGAILAKPDGAKEIASESQLSPVSNDLSEPTALSLVIVPATPSDGIVQVGDSNALFSPATRIPNNSSLQSSAKKRSSYPTLVHKDSYAEFESAQPTTLELIYEPFLRAQLALQMNVSPRTVHVTAEAKIIFALFQVCSRHEGPVAPHIRVTQTERTLMDFMHIDSHVSSKIAVQLDLVLRHIALTQTLPSGKQDETGLSLLGGEKTKNRRHNSRPGSNNNSRVPASTTSRGGAIQSADVLSFSSFTRIVDELLKHMYPEQEPTTSESPMKLTAEVASTLDPGTSIAIDPRMNTRRLDLLGQLREFLLSLENRHLAVSLHPSTTELTTGNMCENRKILCQYRVCLSGIVRTATMKPIQEGNGGLTTILATDCPIPLAAIDAKSSLEITVGLMNIDRKKVALAKKLIDLNMEQMKNIFSSYSTSTDGKSAHVKSTVMRFEDCRDMLTDFGIVPHYIDLQTLGKIFRSTKFWEWYVMDCMTHLSVNKHTEAHPEYEEICSVSLSPQNVNIIENILYIPSACSCLCLSFGGFIECIMRVACHGNKLGTTPHDCLQSMLHLMNASGGLVKRSRASRKSTMALRHFVFS